MSETPKHTHYFTVDEAASALKWVAPELMKARKELGVIYDEIVLQKRIYTLQYVEREGNYKDHEDILERKVEQFEECHQKWVSTFADKGVLIRDVQRGLVEFPYEAEDGELFYLSWHPGDEGLFYFHEAGESYRVRRPISLLPN